MDLDLEDIKKSIYYRENNKNNRKLWGVRNWRLPAAINLTKVKIVEIWDFRREVSVCDGLDGVGVPEAEVSQLVADFLEVFTRFDKTLDRVRFPSVWNAEDGGIANYQAEMVFKFPEICFEIN